MAWSTSKHKGSTRESRRTRQLVLTMWPHCYLQYPGCTGTSTEDDHVVPFSQGGTDHLTNRRGACHHCHQTKTLQEAATGRRRRRNPTEPPHPGLTQGG
jgi:5-methylcytosine-specific restriction protein A